MNKYYIEKITLTKKGWKCVVRIKEDTVIYDILIERSLEDLLNKLKKHQYNLGIKETSFYL